MQCGALQGVRKLSMEIALSFYKNPTIQNFPPPQTLGPHLTQSSKVITLDLFDDQFILVLNFEDHCPISSLMHHLTLGNLKWCLTHDLGLEVEDLGALGLRQMGHHLPE